MAICARFINGFVCVPIKEVIHQMNTATLHNTYASVLAYAVTDEPNDADYGDDEDGLLEGSF